MTSISCYAVRHTSMVRHALILAAGRGRPVADSQTPNCISAVAGVPLILRTLRGLASAGIRRVGIVVGWKGDELRRRIEALCASEHGLPSEILFFNNPSWEKPNGLSLLAARSFVTERTLLVMADQIAAPHLVRDMAQLPAARRGHGAGSRSGSVARVRLRRCHQGSSDGCPGQRNLVPRHVHWQGSGRPRRRQRGTFRHVAHARRVSRRPGADQAPLR